MRMEVSIRNNTKYKGGIVMIEVLLEIKGEFLSYIYKDKKEDFLWKV